MRVTWDPEKSVINQRQHGISFTVAAQALEDHCRIEDYDLDLSDSARRADRHQVQTYFRLRGDHA